MAMFLAMQRLMRRNGARAMATKEVQLQARILEIPPYRSMIPVLAAELRRARRYKHPTTVLALIPEHEGQRLSVVSAGDAHLHDRFPTGQPIPFLFFLLGSLLRDTMRESDILTYAAHEHLYIGFLPEATEAEARQAIDRFDAVFHARTHIRLRAGLAEFPRDGFTIEDLFDYARNDCRCEPLTNGSVLQLRDATNA